MTIKFQADTDFNQNIVTGVLRQESAIDFLLNYPRRKYRYE